MYLWYFFKCGIHFRGGTLLSKLMQHCDLLKFLGYVGPFLFFETTVWANIFPLLDVWSSNGWLNFLDHCGKKQISNKK